MSSSLCSAAICCQDAKRELLWTRVSNFGQSLFLSHPEKPCKMVFEVAR